MESRSTTAFKKYSLLAAVLLVLGAYPALGDIIAYTNTPATASVTSSSGEYDYAYLTFDGISLTQASTTEELTLTAFADKNAADVLVALGVGTSVVSEGATIDSGSGFAGGTLLHETGNGKTDSFNGYLALQFDDGSDTYYGWAEISASVDTGNPSTASITVSRMAYNDVAGEAIQAGQVIPEPATMMLIMMAGGGMLIGRRIRAQLKS